MSESEESNISQAQPMSGLETGGLETGGLETGSLSAKDRIAASYEDDLSGKNGARARFDAIEELIGKQLEEFSNNMTFSSGGGVRIFGSGGNFAVQADQPRRSAGVDGVAPQSVTRSSILWDLVVNNPDSASVSVRVGSILRSPLDLRDGLAVVNGNAAFNVANGDMLFLKMTNIASPVVTLTKAPTWPDFPARYEVSGSGSTATFAAYYYPLYYFSTIVGADAKAVNDSLYAYRLVENTNFELIYTMFYSPGSQAVLVPKFIGSHAVVPA